MEPLQTGALDPAWAVSQPSGVKIEGCSNAHQQRRLKATEPLRHESFLFGGAWSNPHDMRLGALDGGQHLLFKLMRKRPERRRESACNN